MSTFAVGTHTAQDTSGVENLILRGGAGADSITAGNGLASLTSLTLRGGAGDDTLTGGDGSDLLIGGAGNEVANGGRGNDTARLGSGDDAFVWNPGDGSDTVEGQSGSDVLALNGANVSEHMAVSAVGSRVRLVRDVGAVSMDLNGIEDLHLAARGGADAITVNDLTGTDVKSAAIDLSGGLGTGDGQPDTVTLNGTSRADHADVSQHDSQVLTRSLTPRTTIVGSDGPSDTLNINTLAGTDTVAVAPDVSAFITPVIDLGADQ